MKVTLLKFLKHYIKTDNVPAQDEEKITWMTKPHPYANDNEEINYS